MILYYAKSEEHIWNPQWEALEECDRQVRYNNIERRRIGKSTRRFDAARKEVAKLRPNESEGRHAERTILGIFTTGRYLEELGMQKDDMKNSSGRSTRIPKQRRAECPDKRYLDESSPVQVGRTSGHDIPPLNSLPAERLGYPTQKPQALLERIIQASSNEGTWCSIRSAGAGRRSRRRRSSSRRWVGIDITSLAISLIKKPADRATARNQGRLQVDRRAGHACEEAAGAGGRKPVSVPVVGARPRRRPAGRTEEGGRQGHRRPDLLPRRRPARPKRSSVGQSGQRQRGGWSATSATSSIARRPRSASSSPCTTPPARWRKTEAAGCRLLRLRRGTPSTRSSRY